jgi:hypothetical protein
MHRKHECLGAGRFGSAGENRRVASEETRRVLMGVSRNDCPCVPMNLPGWERLQEANPMRAVPAKTILARRQLTTPSAHQGTQLEIGMRFRKGGVQALRKILEDESKDWTAAALNAKTSCLCNTGF